MVTPVKYIMQAGVFSYVKWTNTVASGKILPLDTEALNELSNVIEFPNDSKIKDMELSEETVFSASAGKSYKFQGGKKDGYYLYDDLMKIFTTISSENQTFDPLNIEKGDKMSSYDFMFLQSVDGIYLLKNPNSPTAIGNRKRKTVLSVGNKYYNEADDNVKILTVQSEEEVIAFPVDESLFLAKMNFSGLESLLDLCVFNADKFDKSFESEEVLKSNASIVLEKFQANQMGITTSKIPVHFENTEEIKRSFDDPANIKRTSALAKHTPSKKRTINKLSIKTFTDSIDNMEAKIEAGLTSIEPNYLPEFVRDTNGLITSINANTLESVDFVTGLLTNKVIEKWLDGKVQTPSAEMGTGFSED